MSEEKVTLSDGKEAARQQILDLVAEYCDKYHNQKKEFTEGQRIPYASRVYDNHEMVNLVDSALEFWLTSGRYTDQFEAGLANYLGVKYCSLVNSGSSANLIAFMALTSPLLGERRVRRGDEIITVAAGFPTTVTPAIQYGAVPVFVDVTIPQYNIDADKLEAALSEKTKAVMIAHTLGNPFDLQKVKEFCFCASCLCLSLPFPSLIPCSTARLPRPASLENTPRDTPLRIAAAIPYPVIPPEIPEKFKILLPSVCPALSASPNAPPTIFINTSGI